MEIENTLSSISCTTSEDISTDPMLSNVALYSLPRLVPMVELSVPMILFVSELLMQMMTKSYFSVPMKVIGSLYSARVKAL